VLSVLDKLHLTPLGTEHYLIADKDYILDMTKAQEELGWIPRHGYAEMMIAAYDWYIEHRQQIQSVTDADFPNEKLLKIIKLFS